jgi:transposase-like protein
MSKNLLSNVDIAKLHVSPYIITVSQRSLSFSAEFKRLAYEQILAGKTMRSIFVENGINPDIIGDKRIQNFRYWVKRYAERDAGFENLRTNNHRRPAKSRETTLENRVKDLEHELAYTRQEVEFLKKIQAADMEARKQWESGHRQK